MSSTVWIVVGGYDGHIFGVYATDADAVAKQAEIKAQKRTGPIQPILVEQHRVEGSHERS